MGTSICDPARCLYFEIPDTQLLWPHTTTGRIEARKPDREVLLEDSQYQYVEFLNEKQKFQQNPDVLIGPKPNRIPALSSLVVSFQEPIVMP